MNADGSVNQKAIKTAVMNAMPDYLKAEGLDNPQTFWWGDIHLNTNHVHVHLAISQKKLSYGNSIKDTVQPRDDKLRDQLVNLLFANLRDYESKRKLYKKDRLQILKEQGPELNKRIMKAEETALKSMDGSSDVAREIRMRLGLRRYYLKLYNLDRQIDDLTKRIDGLYSLGELTKLIRKRLITAMIS